LIRTDPGVSINLFERRETDRFRNLCDRLRRIEYSVFRPQARTAPINSESGDIGSFHDHGPILLDRANPASKRMPK